jgi:Predicted membrane protein
VRTVLKQLARTAGGLCGRSPQQRISRTVVKTLLYRVLMVLITVLIALLVTGNTGQALSIGIVANGIKTATYYGYERLWSRISWGTTADD